MKNYKIHDWKYKKTNAFSTSIYICGDIETIKNVCRKYCLRIGLCVNTIQADYIYSGGMETGVKIGLINYARFPDKKINTTRKAIELAKKISVECCQFSFSIQTPKDTYYYYRVKKC